MPADGGFPLAWLYSWVPQRGAWAGDMLLGPSGHELNGAAGLGHDASAADNRAHGGNGRAPGHAPGALPAYDLPDQRGKPSTTPLTSGKFDPATSRRLADRSTRTADVFQNADGTLTRQLHPGPVNYRAADGTWQPIETDLQRQGNGRLRMKANSLDVSLGGSSRKAARAADALVSMALPGGQTLGYDLADAADVAPVVDGSLATYRQVLPQTDLELRTFETGVEETLVLASPDAPHSWLYPLHLDGLTPRVEEDGSIALLDAAGKAVASFPRGRMEDSRVDQRTGERISSDKVVFELVKTADGTALRVTADDAWLRDPARVYPVRVDPTATANTGTTADVFVDNDTSTDSSTQNGTSLAVGYDNESPARSFIAFDQFDDNGFIGKRITAASLTVFHTWSWDCTSHLPVYVHKVLQSWSVANLATSTLPGPTRSSAIGTLTIADNYPACTNTGADRNIGKNQTVLLNPGTFNDWSIGGPNYGLALTASETDPKGWKRFTAANYSSGAHKPMLSLTYALNVPPQVDTQYPPHGYQSPTLTPELLAYGQDPDSFPKTLTYKFQVWDKTATTLIAESTPSTDRRWVVPSGKLAWGENYLWTVIANDGQLPSTSQKFNMLSTPVPQPTITSGLSQNGDKGFDPTSGNYTTAATDATVSTVGPSLSVQRSYNSVDPRNGAFGFGWAGIADSRAVERTDATGALQTVLVTYPNGQDVAFGKDAAPATTFSPPSGRFATFKSVTGGGYELVDKDGTRYVFAKNIATGAYAISSAADAQGRTETFEYDASNRLSKMIAASGRKLYFTWSQPSGATAFHVATVYGQQADPADASSVQTWQYNYTGDKLTSVCPPNDWAHCTAYTYETNSVYQSVVLNYGPRSYWRLNETAAGPAKSAVTDNAGVDNGTATALTYNQTGPLSGGTGKAVSFNGTASSVKVPSNLASNASYRSVSMWFKAASGTGDNVLLSQSWDDPATAATSNGAYQPTLYLGSDGKLMGGFPTAPATGALDSIVGTGAGRCMEAGIPLNNADRAYIWDCNGGAHQKWTLDSSSRLAVTSNGVTKCLDANGSSTADGTDLIVYSCSTGINQKWTLLADGRIVGQQSGKCVDVEQNGVANGTFLQLWSCGPVPKLNQAWHSRLHAPMATTASYADGNWHHAVLSAFGDQQKIYVDGVEKASQSGLFVRGIEEKSTYLGLGYLGGNWPNQSHADANKNTGTRDYFNGSLAEAAFFDRALTADDAKALFDAKRSTELLKTVKRPSGTKIAASVNYDRVSGMVSDVTDENGGVWKLNAPVVQGTSLVYQSTVLAALPVDYYRFAETGTSTTINQINGNVATYNNVTLGAANGPFADSTVADFNGTTSYVATPATLDTSKPFSVSAWVKMDDKDADQYVTVIGGAIGSAFKIYYDKAGDRWRVIGKGTKTDSTQAWWDLPSPANLVKIGEWTHLAVTADTTTNAVKLYVNGAQVASLTSPVPLNNSGGNGNIGSEYSVGYWDGGIAEFATFRQALSASQVAAQFTARDKVNGTQGESITTTDPDNKSQITITDLNTGRKIAETDARGKTTRYGYDVAGFLRTVTDPDGNVTITEHDVRGNTVSSTTCQDYSTNKCSTVYYSFYPDAVTRVLTPDPRNDVMTEMRDGRSASGTDNTYRTTYQYDTRGNRTAVVDPLGRVTSTVYTDAPTLTGSTTCSASETPDKAFDLNTGTGSKFCSNVASAWLQAQWPTAQTFTTVTVRHAEAGGEAASLNTKDFDILTSNDGTAWTTQLQVRGNTSAVSKHTLPAPVAAKYLKISVLVPAQDGSTSTRIYDVEAYNATVPAGLPRTTTTPGGAVQTVEYYPNGDVAKVTDPGGLVTTYVYDDLGRRTSETEINKSYPAGVTTSYKYDKANRVETQTDPTITNRITGAQHTAITTTVYDYDGNVLSETTADTLVGGDAPRTKSSTYNQYNQVLTSTDEAGKTTTLYYDNFGRVVREVEQNGDETLSTYDETGNLTTTTVKGWRGDPANPLPAPGIDLVLTSKAYYAAGRLASETDAEGVTSEYTYTDNGLVAKVVRKKGTSSFTVEQNTYDAAGNLTQQVTNNGATTMTYKYDAANRQYESTLDPAGLNRTTTQALDADDRVISTTDKDGTGKVYGYNESIYDPMGREVAATTYLSATSPTPVGRWKLDETAGTTAADAAGNNPAKGTNLSWSTEHGTSASFGGATYLTTTGTAVDSKRSFTVAAWVRLADNTQTRKILGTSGDQQNPFDLRYDSTGAWKFTMKNGDVADAGFVGPASTSTPAVNTWTHLAGVFDATTKTMRLYVNGVQEGTDTVSTPFSTVGPLVIGAGMFNGSRGNYWKGEIDDVQLYQKALSTSEISGIVGGTVPAADAKVIRSSSQLDVDGAVKAVTDAMGNTTTYEVDEAGRMVKTTTPQVTTETYGQAPVQANAVSWAGYDTFGGVSDSQDALGNWTRTEYDAAGHVVKVRMPSYTPPGSSTPITPETTSTYDDLGQVKTVTDPMGEVSSYDYDQLGRVWRKTAPDGGVTKYTYNNTGDVLTVTDPEGAVSETVYDYLGRTDKTREYVRQTSQTLETKYTYGFGGWVSDVTSPGGVHTGKTYNTAGQTLTSTDSANKVTNYGYDGGGRLEQTTLPDGSYTKTGYDLADRAVSSSAYKSGNTLLKTESTEYDANSNVLSSTDALGYKTTFAYDATGLLASYRQPISGSDSILTSFGYDLAGNRTRFTDGRGNPFWTTFNTMGLPESVIEPATATHPNAADYTYTTAYDAAGRTVSQTQPGGVSITFDYDEMGRLTSQSGTGAEVVTADRVFGYDHAGRMTTLSGSGGTNTLVYDDRGLPTSVTGPSGNSSFQYNADGGMTKRSDAAGDTVYGYDAATGRLATVTNGTAVQATYEYNNLSQVNKITYSGTRVRTIGYDDLHRMNLDELKTTGATPTTVAKVDYTYDLNGNERTKTTTGFAKSGTNTYDYDQANRLTSWNDGTNITVYAYDKSGNRVQNGAKTFTYDERNRLITGAGANYSYTPRGTLSQVSDGSGTFATLSDAFDMVASQQAAGGTQTYEYDGLGRAIRPGFSYTGVGNDLAGDGTATYVRGTAGELVGEVAGAAKRYAFTDAHTDVVGQFTATGTVLDGSTAYDPLGKVLQATGMIGNLGYQSEWTDNLTSRVNMHARWYNPDTGQFDSRDTVSNNPVPASIGANRYQYGDGIPLIATDESGHCSWYDVVCGAKKVASSAVQKWNNSSVGQFVNNSVSTAYHSTVSWGYGVANRALGDLSNAADSLGLKGVKKWADSGRKYTANKAAAHKQQAKAAYNKAKQAGHAVRAQVERNVRKAGNAIKDAYKATEKWVEAHKAEIAGVVAGVVVGAVCGAAIGWTGIGAVGCGALAGAVGSAVTGTMKGHTGWELVGDIAFGTVTGAALGGLGSMVGSGLKAVVGGGMKNALAEGLSGAVSKFGGAFRAEGANILGGARSLGSGALGLGQAAMSGLKGAGRSALGTAVRPIQQLVSSFTKPAGGYVNIFSKEATRHVLQGDSATSGGHLWPGNAGKSLFPWHWSGDKIMHAVSDIVTDPATAWSNQTGTQGSLLTRALDPAKWITHATRWNVNIRVIYQPFDNLLKTAFPPR
ncbi:LamG-like jellyroll fold domain-containing protein [Catellatospora sp. TT07R-123]|uniref:LamG-like jellyroll fold domain-containing protein n=1 Tax=Catellatospora sp. TT07R-123 TaxID=2733863 RepID=UPI001BB3F7FF|nr:LamG-like jellyroll fold domain-containing protein [Catellatospora sp. TT07R-123]